MTPANFNVHLAPVCVRKTIFVYEFVGSDMVGAPFYFKSLIYGIISNFRCDDFARR